MLKNAKKTQTRVKKKRENRKEAKRVKRENSTKKQ